MHHIPVSFTSPRAHHTTRFMNESERIQFGSEKEENVCAFTKVVTQFTRTDVNEESLNGTRHRKLFQLRLIFL
jgi:hypothetical protein